MQLFRFTGEAEVYSNPFDLYASYKGPRIMPVDTNDVAENEAEAMRHISTDISCLYSDDWRWIQWYALPI